MNQPQILTKEQEELVTKNIALAYYLFKKLYNDDFKNSHGDDLISEGLMGLVKAAKTYDPTKCKFATYATRCIQNQFFMYIRKQKDKFNRTFSLDAPIDNDSDGTEITLADSMVTADWTTSDNIDKAIEVDYRQMLVDAFFETRPARNKEVYVLMSHGKTQKEVAEILGFSQSYVSRLLRNINQAFAKFKSRRERRDAA